MTSRRKTRTVAALVTALALALAACGTRLDHDIIAAAGGGTGTGVAGTGLPGGEAGTGLPGDAGTGNGTGGEGDVGAGPGGEAGTGPAATGRDGTGRDGTGTGPDGTGGSNGAPIVVGTVESYSGAAGAVTKSGALALQAWAATTNSRGGINGRPIKLIIRDDGGDSAKARALLQKLVEQDKAVAVLGVDSYGLASFIKYLEDKRVPALGSCQKMVFNSPVFFSPCNTIRDAVHTGAQVGAKYGKGKKIGILACVENPDCTEAADIMFSESAKKFGLEPVYRADVSVAKPNFTDNCIEARRRGVELLAAFVDPNSVVRVAADCRRQGFHPQFLQGEAISRADFATTPGLTDVLVGSRIFPYAGLSTPAAKEFETAWKKYAQGAQPTGNASKAWAAAKVFEAAVKKAGKNVSSESLIKALYSFSGETFGGLTVPLTFTPKGSRPASCGFSMRAVNGKWVAEAKPVCF